MGVVGENKLTTRLNHLVILAESLCPPLVDVEVRSIGRRETVEDIRTLEHLVDRHWRKRGNSEDTRSNAGLAVDGLCLGLGVAGRIAPEGNLNVLRGCRCLNPGPEGEEGLLLAGDEDLQEVGVEQIPVVLVARPREILRPCGPCLPKPSKRLRCKTVCADFLKHSVCLGRNRGDPVRFWVTKTDRLNSGEDGSTPYNTLSTQHTMASLAATITAAILKVSLTNPAMDRDGGPTADEARDHFTALLLHELGLGPMPAAAHAPVVEPKTADAEPAKKAPKKRAAKKSTEAIVAEAAVAVLEPIKGPEVEALAEQLGQLALEEQPKPKKARKTKAESAATSESESEKPKEKKKPGPKPKAVSGAGAPAPEPVPAPEPAKKKPGPKPKAKPEGPVNVEKLTPTHKKHLKAIAEELKVDPRDKEFLAYANDMSAEEWGAKPLDAHIRAFLTPIPPEPAAAPTSFVEVTFNGKDYLVNPATKIVYAATDDGRVRARDERGVVGVNEFADLELPEEEDE
jgi:hypothetical protein